MTWLRNRPIRSRLTIVFTAAMAVLLTLMGAALYFAARAELLDELDTSLRFRAAAAQQTLPNDLNLHTTATGLVEPGESFAQLLAVDGKLLDATPGFDSALLSADDLRDLGASHFYERPVAGVAHGARMLAVRVNRDDRSLVIVVGSSMGDYYDALRAIVLFFAIGGPIALLIVGAAGWHVTRASLRPVETMRSQAAEITESGPDARITIPAADDELRRLALTLNAMLERLDTATQAERRFLDNASHELRLPLTALRAELELAMSRERSHHELLTAITNASTETEYLVRLCEDLLLLSRSRNGKLSLQLEPVDLRALMEASIHSASARAERSGIATAVHGDAVAADVDPLRMRQAIDNLIDNALRHARSEITLGVRSTGDEVIIEIHDDGPGFDATAAHRAFEPFATGDNQANDGHQSNGLGLAIVAMIVHEHAGTVAITNAHPNGATVTLTLPA